MSFLKVPVLKSIRCQPWPDNSFKLPTIQSHRGFCVGGQQENSLASFRMARLKGAKMVECDLRLSKDLIPVMCHDEDVKRISGKDGKVNEMTAAEIESYANVPSLEKCLTDPEMPEFWNLEIKSAELVDDQLERQIAAVVKKTKSVHKVMISSFNPGSISRMHEFLPLVPRALLATEEKHPKNKVWLREMWAAPVLSFHMLNLDYQMLTPEFVSILTDKKIPFTVWTVNGSVEVQNFLNIGAASVISDNWLTD